jgi:TrmH family RNA methyltransferase
MISKNQIKQIQALHLKKHRDVSKLFLVEGVKTVKELLQHRSEAIKELYATNDFIQNNLNILQSKKIRFYEISEVELKQISVQTTPNNVLAICDFFETESIKFDFETSYSFYLDDIRDPGNFGTIIRLADWFGVSTIFCSPNSCDFYNPKVIQSTMGAFLRVNVIYVSLADLIKSNKINNVYGAVLNGKNIYTEKLNNGIIVIGNEANGISDKNIELINKPITIPSHHANGTESLNAAMATSIITSEFFRQLNS